jgi:hypothetical protein
VALDPDEQAQAVIRLVFGLFDRLGTVNGVLCFLADNHIQLGVRVREGPERGELQWRRPSRTMLQNILRNPAYAGIYAYGRSTTDPRRRQAGRPCTGRVRTAREDWIVFLPGLLPAYISIGQYEKNGQRMEANRSRSQSAGAVRDGPALLAGLVACGRCGARMTVHYQRGAGGKLQPVYVCAREKTDYGGGQCQQLAGSCVDGYVTGLLLDALAPAALEVSLAAAEQAGAQRAQVDQIWRQRLERAGFAADRARRQYQLTEPENRLVARQLEKDWEAALADRQRLGEEYDRFTASRPRTLTPAERSQIRALAADVPAIWHAPTTTDADRKQLIRHLVERVRAEVLATSEKVNIQVIWAGGHRTTGQISRPVACLTQLSYYPQLAGRARELADARLSLAQIADRLNAEGFRPPKRCQAFTANAVSDLLRVAGARRPRIPAHRPPLAGHEWWLRDLAGHLAMSPITLDSWVRRGWATGYLHPAIKLIVVRADPAEVERLRTLHQTPRGQHNRRPWLKNQQPGTTPDNEGAGDDANKPQI